MATPDMTGPGAVSGEGVREDDPAMLDLRRRIAAVPFWYHRIALPYGLVTPGESPQWPEAYRLPDRLDGERVLDVGAWDGYWSFEALRRGAAEVVAIDDFSDRLGYLTEQMRPQWETFDLCRAALGYSDDRCRRQDLSVYDVRPETVGMFDRVLFFGVLYHLRHPLLGLDRMASVCRGTLHVESAVSDHFSPYRGGFGQGYDGAQMVMEFYPTDQYGSNDSNWWAPTLRCVGGMLYAAGFRDIETWPLTAEPPQTIRHCRGFAIGRMPADRTTADSATPVRGPD